MVRKLKYHEQKLLKKVDFLNVIITHICRETRSMFPVEAGCKSSRNKGDATVPSAGQGGLPQVRLCHSINYC